MNERAENEGIIKPEPRINNNRNKQRQRQRPPNPAQNEGNQQPELIRANNLIGKLETKRKAKIRN